jgi:hypothetical protein
VEKKYLFMCGTPRSGTSYLAGVIGSHPAIVLGVERFKFHYARRSLAPELFQRDRFFDLRAEDTSLPERIVLPQCKAMREKFDRCEFVGDKYPSIVQHIDLLCSRFHDPTFLYVLRNPVSVGKSWADRARDPADHWPAENDFSAGIRYWLDSIRRITKARMDGRKISVIDYDLLVSGDARGAELHLNGVFLDIGTHASSTPLSMLLDSRRVDGKGPEKLACGEDEHSDVRRAIHSEAWDQFLSGFATERFFRMPEWTAAFP